MTRPALSSRTNDNWADSQQAEIEATGLAPADELESAIVRTLAPGSYTAVVAGRNGATGTAVVEAYDLNQTSNSTLANISTRGAVGASKRSHDWRIHHLRERRKHASVGPLGRPVARLVRNPQRRCPTQLWSCAT